MRNDTRSEQPAARRRDDAVTAGDGPTAPSRAERRFDVLAELVDRNSAVDLETLADAVAAGDDDPQHVAVSLHHVDLPTLSAAELVSYDPERCVASLTADGVAAPQHDGGQ